MNILETDEFTNNYNSEDCKSTLFAHQLETRSILNDDKINTRYNLLLKKNFFILFTMDLFDNFAYALYINKKLLL